MWLNDQFGMEVAKPTRTVFLALSGVHPQLPGTIPMYSYVEHNLKQPPQHPPACYESNSTMNFNKSNFSSSNNSLCILADAVCLGAVSGVPWLSWGEVVAHMIGGCFGSYLLLACSYQYDTSQPHNN
jgi:hypothetical protein